jgi:Zn finger protein HypA/HybF involved in hydrogenase expression
MKKKVVCSDCGASFEVTKKRGKEGFSPSFCPSCEGIILQIVASSTATDYLSLVKRK